MKIILLVIYKVVINFMITRDINVKTKISIIVKENNVLITKKEKIVLIIVRHINRSVLIFQQRFVDN